MTPRRLAAGSCLAVALLFATAACSGDDSGTDTQSSATLAPDGTDTPPEETAAPGETLSPDDSIGPDDTEVASETSLELEPPPPEIPDDTDPPAMLNLPADGPATVGGVDLPAGTVLINNEQRLTWITDDVVANAGQVWLQLYEAFPETGLYPVLLYDDDQPAGWETETFFGNQPYLIDDLTIEAVLQSSAEFNFDEPRTSPGPAPASSGPQDLDATDAVIAAMPDARLALVETPRGADAVSYMGWTGNSIADGGAESLATAIRSWEDRYGARLVGVGPNSVRIAISRPPANSDEADALSDELVVLDPALESGGAPIETIGLGDDLLGERLWTLWWLS